MITDVRPLNPAISPAEVVYRDAEVNSLSGTLRPIIRSKHPTPPFSLTLTTGKTHIGRCVTDQLHKEVLDVATLTGLLGGILRLENPLAPAG